MIDEREERVLDDDDLALGVRAVDGDVDERLLADLYQHVAAHELLIEIVNRQRVRAGRQRADEVLAVLVGDHDLLADERRRGRDHDGADRGLLRRLVPDDAARAADRRARLRERGRWLRRQEARERERRPDEDSR